MNIDFNNVRRQAILEYNRLVTLLNEGKQENDYGDTILKIDDLFELSDVLSDLRNLLVFIAGTYDEKGDKDFVSILDEFEKGIILVFTDEIDEQQEGGERV